MSINQQLRLVTARCLSVLQRYHDEGRVESAKAKMVAEVELIIGYLIEINPTFRQTETDVLGHVEEHLLSRYGSEAGRRINQDFLDAFEGAGMVLLFRPRYIYNNHQVD